MDRELDQLPYYLRGACWALLQLEQTRQGLGTFTSNFPNQQMFAFDDDQVDPLRFMTDAFLMNVRRSFDAMIIYLRRFPVRAARDQIPRSLTVLMKGLETGNDYKLDPKVTATLLAYWNSIGQRITKYRDLGHHYTMIVSDCITYARDGQAYVRAVLPDSPASHSAAGLTYDPGVPLMGFVSRALEETLVMVNVVLNRLISLTFPEAKISQLLPPKPGGIRVTMRFTGRGCPQFPMKHLDGEAVPFPIDLFELARRSAAEALVVWQRDQGQPDQT